MRPPVETPSMNKPRLRVSKVPVKHSATFRISWLSRGLVPFIISCQFSLVVSFQLSVIS